MCNNNTCVLFYWFQVGLLFFLYPLSMTFTMTQKDIFATKTAYSWANDDLHGYLPENTLSTLNMTKSQCKAVFALVILRHGARNPGAKDIRKMTEIQNKLNKNNEEYPFIQKWKNRYRIEKEKHLTKLGVLEQKSLGRKFAKYLRNLFENDVSNVKFVVSSKQRSNKSAASFYNGFTDYFEKREKFSPFIQDHLLRFHDRCDLYKHLVEGRSDILDEYEKFREGKLVRNIAENVSSRLGMATPLTPGDVQLLFFLCAFEMANDNESDWCSLLTWDEMKVMEYMSDMKQYLKKAYGHDMIGRMSCLLVKAIFEELDLAVKAYDSRIRHSPGMFMFGHAETLAPLYAGLGLFKDHLPLTTENYHHLQNRSFKSSKILPFSANLAFILYHCQPSEENSINEHSGEFTLRLLLNGEPLKMPHCDKDICSYKKLRENYSTQVDHCNFDNLCQMKNKHTEL